MASAVTLSKLCSLYIKELIENINRIHHISMNFPSSLILIVEEYAKTPFEWDTKHAQGIEISEDKLRATSTQNGNHIVLSADALSSEIVSRVKWEVVISNVNANGQKICFAIGFFMFPVDESKDFLEGTRQCSVYIHDLDYQPHFEVDEFNRSHSLKDTKCKDVQDLDRFQLIFDFEQSICTFYYNSKFCATVTKKMPGHLVPAIAMYGKSLSLECTQWSMVYRTVARGLFR